MFEMPMEVYFAVAVLMFFIIISIASAIHNTRPTFDIACAAAAVAMLWLPLTAMGLCVCATYALYKLLTTPTPARDGATYAQ